MPLGRVHLKSRSARHKYDVQPRPIFTAPSTQFASGPGQLPNELLIHIFLLAQEPPRVVGKAGEHLDVGDPLLPWPTIRCAVIRSRVRLVCHRWRDVLDHSARAWTNVEIHTGMHVKHLENVLARSGSMDIQVECFFNQRTPSWGPIQPLVLGVAEQCDLIRDMLHALARHASRWISFMLVAQEAIVVDTLLEFLDRGAQIVTLSSFSVFYCGRLVYPRIPTIHHLFPPAAMIRAPATPLDPRLLTELRLRGCCVDWTALRDTLAPNLSYLHIESVYNRVDVANFVRLLEICVRLKWLRLAGSFIRVDDGIESVDEPDLRVFLPSLLELYVSEVPSEVMAMLLRHLATPNLRVLGLDLPYIPIPLDTPDYSLVHSALAENTDLVHGLTIQTLYLRRFGLRLSLPNHSTAKAGTNFYLPFSRVQSLILDFNFLHIELWRSLLEGLALAVLPALTTLTLSGLSVGCVQEYVVLRRRAGLAPVHIVILCDEQPLGFADDYHRPTTLHWLRRHTLSCRLVCTH